MGDSAASSRVVIIIRVWLEDHPEFPLRAVITSAPPDTTTAGVTMAAKTIVELCEAVRSIVAELRLDDHR